jgi:putative mRNA 3-end processing factor
MSAFNTSKGCQDIYMSPATRRLLIAELNAELSIRENIKVVKTGTIFGVGDNRVELVPSGHMLGSVQVAVAQPHGPRLGYSGDFQWPLERTIEVDALVVDSTYGSPAQRREYTQAEAESRLVALILERLMIGPVHIKAFRGTLQRALQLLSGEVAFPMVASKGLCRTIQVYRELGYGIGTVLEADSADGLQVKSEPQHIHFYGNGENLPIDVGNGSTITLSAFFAKPDDPVLPYSEQSYGVALSNHADFQGTVEYVRTTGASYVVTDNRRGGKAIELALELSGRLGIEAVPSTSAFSREWGA